MDVKLPLNATVGDGETIRYPPSQEWTGGRAFLQQTLRWRFRQRAPGRSPL